MIGGDKTQVLERLNRTLKAQLSDRDAKISKCQNELNHATEKLEEATRVAHNECSRATEAEARASKAEKDFSSAKNEISKLRLNVSNFEARLRAEEEKNAQATREMKRLEYELESSSSPFGANPDNKVAERLKAVEAELARKQKEIAQLRSEKDARSTHTPPSPVPALDFFGAPVVEKKRLSGSSTTSSHEAGRTEELTRERDTALESARKASSERDALNRKVVDANRDRDRACNELMAVEKRSKKAIAALEDQIEDLRFELDGAMGRGDPKVDNSAVEKLRTEVNDLNTKIDGLEESATVKDAELQRLRPLEHDLSVSRDEVAALTGQLHENEAELESATTALATATADLEAATSATGASTTALAESKGTIAALESHLAGLQTEMASTSATFAGVKADLVSAEERVTASEAERDNFKSTLEEKALALETMTEQHSALSTQLETVKTVAAEVELLRQTLATKEAEMAALQARVDAAGDAAAALQDKDAELARTKTMFDNLTTELIDLETSMNEELDSVRAELESKTAELAEAKENLSRAMTDRHNALASIKLLEAELTRPNGDIPTLVAEHNKELEALRTELATSNEARARAVAEVAERAAAVTTLENQVLSLKPSANGSAAEKTRFSQMANTIQRLRDERDEARDQLRFVQTEHGFLLRGAKDEKNVAVREMEAIQVTLTQKTVLYDSLKAEQDKLVARVAELEVEAQLDTVNMERIAELEAERTNTLKQVGDLDKQIATLKGELDTANLQLKTLAADLESEKARRREAEHHVKRIQAAGVDEKHKVEVEELNRRMGRRNAEIKNLKTGIQKLEWQLKSAQEDAQNLMETSEEATQENKALQASLKDTRSQLNTAIQDAAAKVAELGSIQASLTKLEGAHGTLQAEHSTLCEAHSTFLAQADAVARDSGTAEEQLAQHTARAAELEASLATAQATVASSADIQDLVIAIALQRQAVAAATSHAQKTQSALADALAKAAANEARIASLTEEQGVLLQQGSVSMSLRRELETARDELSASQRLASGSEDRIAQLVESETALKTKLADTKEQCLKLEHSVANMGTALTNTKASLQKAHADLSVAHDEHVAVIQDLKTAASNGQKDYAEILRKAQAAQTTVRELEEKVADMSAKLKTAERDLAAAKDEADNAANEHAATKQELEDSRGELRTTRTEIETATAKLNASEADVVAVRAKLDAAVANLESLSGDYDEVRLKLQAFDSDLATARFDLSTVRGDLIIAREEASSVRDEVEVANARRAEVEEEATTARTDLETYRGDLATIRSRLQSTEGDLAALQTEIASLRSEADSNANLADELATAHEQLDEAHGSLAVLRGERDTATSALDRERVDMGEKLATAETDLVKTRADLATASATAEEMRVKLTAIETKDKLNALSTMQGDAAPAAADAQAPVVAREAKIAELEKDSKVAAVSAFRVAELETLLHDAQAEHDAPSSKAVETAAARETLTATETLLRKELESARGSLAEVLKTVDDAAARATAAEADAKAIQTQLETVEVKNIELSSQLSSLRHQLASQSESNLKAAPANSEELAALVEKNAALKQQVEEAQEDLQRAMDSLTSKTNEIDEADDRAMELNKEIKRLKKRADKLERQNKSLTSELDALKAAPVAVPAAKPVAVAAAEEPKATSTVTPATTPGRSPGSGLKRRREEDEPALPTGVRVQAGPAPAKRGSRDENETTPTSRTPLKPSATSATRARALSAKKSPHSAAAERKTLGAKNVFAPQPGNVK